MTRDETKSDWLSEPTCAFPLSSREEQNFYRLNKIKVFNNYFNCNGTYNILTPIIRFNKQNHSGFHMRFLFAKQTTRLANHSRSSGKLDHKIPFTSLTREASEKFLQFFTWEPTEPSSLFTTTTNHSEFFLSLSE